MAALGSSEGLSSKLACLPLPSTPPKCKRHSEASRASDERASLKQIKPQRKLLKHIELQYVSLSLFVSQFAGAEGDAWLPGQKGTHARWASYM